MRSQSVLILLSITLLAFSTTHADTPRITILSTMLSNFSGEGEWGFSALLETETEDILFDTGFKPETVLNNARALGIDLSTVERVVLSHFHTDHTGGLFTLRTHYRKINPKAFSKVYVGKGFFEPRYDRDHQPSYTLSGREGAPATPEAYKAAAADLNIEFVELNSPIELLPNLHLTGPIERIHPERNYSPGNFLVKGESYIADWIPESQAIGIDDGKQWVLLSGCGHAGIVNASEKLRSLKQQDIAMGVGGFHLFRANQEEINWTADKLHSFGLKKFVGAHCTGISATYQIGAQLNLPHSDISVGAIGTRIDSNLNIIRASVE